MMLRRCIGLAFALVCWAILAGPARAEVSANDILRLYDTANSAERAIIEANIGGVENGFGWANSFLTQQRNQAALYCLPEKLALTSPEIIGILRRGVRDDTRLGAAPFGLALLIAIQRAYPCS